MLAPKGRGPVPFRDDDGLGTDRSFGERTSGEPRRLARRRNAAAAPEEVKTYFAAIHEMNARRNRMILEGLDELLARFDELEN